MTDVHSHLDPDLTKAADADIKLAFEGIGRSFTYEIVTKVTGEESGDKSAQKAAFACICQRMLEQIITDNPEAGAFIVKEAQIYLTCVSVQGIVSSLLDHTTKADTCG